MTTVYRRFNIVRHPATWLLPACLLLAVLVYWPGLSGDYMFDDRSNLLENPQLEFETLSVDKLLGASFSSNAGDLRRPVSMMSFALNRWFFGIEPWSYKFINLCIHLLTGIGLWLLGTLVMRAYQRLPQANLAPGIVRWLPLIVAGLWLVHPLNLTTVLYIVQRMAGLAALFTVAGLCLYLLGRLRMQDGRRGWWLILTGLLVCGTLSVFSKENGILLPLYMLVLELCLFRFRSGATGRDRGIQVFFLLTLAIPVLLVLLALIVKPTLLTNYDVRSFTMLERLLTEARVIMFYLKMIVLPSIGELGLYHDDIVISRDLFSPPTTLPAVGAVIALLTIALALVSRHPLISLGILWFFAGHMLESTVLSLEIAHEHRNYLADFGILLSLSALISAIRMEDTGTLIRFGTAALFMVMFTYTTWQRANQWSDTVSHAVYEAEFHPQSPRAVFAAGRVYARLALNDVPDTEDKAYTYLEQARALPNSGIMPDSTILLLKYMLDRPVEPERFDVIRHKLSSAPVSTSDINSLQKLADCFDVDCKIPADVMDDIFEIAIEKRRSPQLETSYGYYRINKRGDFETGLAALTRVVDRWPREPLHWINLITLLLVMEKYDEAEQQLAKMGSVSLHGGNQQTYTLLRSEIDLARSMSTGKAGTIEETS